MLRNIPIHPIFFAIYPILFLYTNNISMLKIEHTFIPILLAVIGTLVLWLIIKLVTKSRYKSAVITSIFLVLFFSYGHIYEIISGFTEKALNVSSDVYLSLSYILVFLLSFLLILFSNKKFKSTSGLLNVTSVILIIFPIYTILVFSPNSDILQSANNTAGSTADEDSIYLVPPQNKPDIYYIILDGYARGDVFEEVYGYDNSKFYDELKSLGFYVAERSHSNYSSTLPSLSSTLNLKYHNSIPKKATHTTQYAYTLMLIDQLSENKVSKILSKIGYKIVTFSTGLSWTDFGNADEKINPKFSFNEYENIIIGTTPLRSLLGLIPHKSPYYLHKQRIIFNLEQLPKVHDREEPVFVFAHILAPHLPFVFGDSNVISSSNTVIDFSEGFNYHKSDDNLRKKYREKYIAQVKVLNHLILNTIRELINKSKDAIIILQSDHGPGSLLDWDTINVLSVKERVSILNAYYFPNDSYETIYNSITPINTFRIIFNKFFNGTQDLLEDKSHFSTLANPYNFILVDDEYNAQY